MRFFMAAIGIVGISLLVTTCSHNVGVCANPTAVRLLKSLILNKNPSVELSPAAENLLVVSDMAETGSSDEVHHCQAAYTVSYKALEAMKTLARGRLPDNRLSEMARNFGMSEQDIAAGIDSGSVEYDLKSGVGDDGAPTFSVVLRTFNIARARLYNSYLDAISLANSAVSLVPPVFISWDAKENGDPKLYRVGDLDITLSSRVVTGDPLPTPVIRIETPGIATLNESGQQGWEDAAATVLVGRLDMSSRANEVLFLTYSGGAHCCTDIRIFEPINGVWRRLDLGSWDDSLASFPRDIDGDHVPDIVLRDGSFNYTFASYAQSYAPPRIFNVVNGAVVDVSSSPRYFNYFRQDMTKSQAGCLLHQNGACAAFVASASRVGLHDYAWQFMLDNYDKADAWDLPKLCDIYIGDKQCPAGHETVPADFPSALSGFLAQHDYYNDLSNLAQHPITPSFDCDRVKSQVLRLVCDTPALAAADQELAAAYYAAISEDKTPETLKAGERAWIVQRNNSPADVDTVQSMYRDRISFLVMLAQLESTAGSH